jgi:ADP-ribose pyrophosphatase
VPEEPTTPRPEPDRRVIYRGKKIDLALQRVKTADGQYRDREVVLHRGAVALVAMVDADRVCLQKNFRHSANATLIEVPAGTIDPGESPDETAARELTEETGFRAGRITRVAEWWVSPGVMTERMYLYVCEDLTPGPPDHQPDEQLENLVVPWDEALRMADDGRIEDAKTLAALLLCDRRRHRRAGGGPGPP